MEGGRESEEKETDDRMTYVDWWRVSVPQGGEREIGRERKGEREIE